MILLSLLRSTLCLHSPSIPSTRILIVLLPCPLRRESSHQNRRSVHRTHRLNQHSPYCWFLIPAELNTRLFLVSLLFGDLGVFTIGVGFHHYYLGFGGDIVLWHWVGGCFVVELFFDESLIVVIEIGWWYTDSVKLHWLFVHDIACLIHNLVLFRSWFFLCFIDLLGLVFAELS